MLLLLFCSSFLFIAGCNTLPSGENVFDSSSDEKETFTEKPSLTLEEAIENTESDLLERFWFRAHIANNIEKRRITHMTINGIVVRPHGYYMINTLMTKQYEYYRWDDEVFIRHEQNWFRAREPELAFDPFYGFSEWKRYLQRAQLVRQDNVLGIPTYVYEIQLTGKELLDNHPSFFAPLKTDELEKITPILEQSTIKVFFYVGDVDNEQFQNKVLPVIYKFQAIIQMPVAGAGYMEQEVQYFIFRVNDESVELTPKEEIEKYVIDMDEYQSMILDKLDEEISKFVPAQK